MVKVNADLAATGANAKTVEELALGFLQVANETMCRPIRALTEAKGYRTSDHELAVFGGAGGQHACVSGTPFPFLPPFAPFTYSFCSPLLLTPSTVL